MKKCFDLFYVSLNFMHFRRKRKVDFVDDLDFPGDLEF